MKTITQHIVNIDGSVIHFKETTDWTDIRKPSMQVFGQSDSITAFVKSLKINEQWMPYGYALRWVLRHKGSKNMTAFFYNISDKFTH